MPHAHTPGPWKWTSASAGPRDEYDCETRGPVDVALFESPGYVDNLELFGPDFENDKVLSAGAGEYCPVHGRTKAEKVANARLIAAAPAMLEALQEARYLLKESGFISALIESRYDAGCKLINDTIAQAEGREGGE